MTFFFSYSQYYYDLALKSAGQSSSFIKQLERDLVSKRRTLTDAQGLLGFMQNRTKSALSSAGGGGGAAQQSSSNQGMMMHDAVGKVSTINDIIVTIADYLDYFYEDMQNDANVAANLQDKGGNGIYLTIQATRGNGYAGDLAIDDIIVTDKPCKTWGEWADWTDCSVSCGGGVRERSRDCAAGKNQCVGPSSQKNRCNTKSCVYWACTFDEGDCRMSQSISDDLDWTRNTGATPSAGTGPEKDVSGYGYYMYLEASSPAKLSWSAKLQCVQKIVSEK